MEGKHETARAPRKNHRTSGAGMTALKVLGTLLALSLIHISEPTRPY